MNDVTITDAQPDRLFLADFTNYESMLILEMIRNIYIDKNWLVQMCALLDIDESGHDYLFKRVVNYLEEEE